jgi:NADH:ubiquinone oxidoreductase subunit
MKVMLQETESKSVPYMADVTIAKQRFSTKLHRKRGEAEKDVNFLRDTGTETATYELRSGKWVRAGSIFVANKSEENVNGEWMAVDETVKRVVPEEEKKAKGGWLKRTWSSFTGKELDEKPPADDKESKKPKGTPGGSQSGMSIRRGF